MKLQIIISGLFLITAACSGPQNDNSTEGEGGVIATTTVPTAEDIALAEKLVPKDAGLAAKYDRSCRTCHSLADAQAPLTGHQAAWADRIENKGQTILVANIKSGLNAMPAMGLCNDCTDDDFIRLTDFMAGKEPQ